MTRTRRMLGWLIAGLLLVTAPAGALATRPFPHLTVLAAGDLRGEINPCGCSEEGQFGGLPRRLQYLEKMLAGNPLPLLVDLGNNFPAPSEQGRLKIPLIQKMLGLHRPDGILPGPNELAMGLDTLDASLPWVLSNDALGKRFPTVREVFRDGGGKMLREEAPEGRIHIYGYLSPATVYQGSQGHFRLLDAASARLREMWRPARQPGVVSILLFRGSDAELTTIAGWGLFDMIVAGNPSADEMKQVTRREVKARDGKRVTVPMVPTKGQGLLRLRLGPPPLNAAPDWPPVDWLDKTYPDHPAAKAAFAEYDAQVKQMFLARLGAMEQHGKKSPFAGAGPDAGNCAQCHTAAAAMWRASRHAGALATLEKVGKSFDPECLACHVVGLGQDGFLSKDLTPALANVQCENCHGPARVHAAAARAQPPRNLRSGPVPSTAPGSHAKPDADTCLLCHKGSHSPKFDFNVYWPKITHGKG